MNGEVNDVKRSAQGQILIAVLAVAVLLRLGVVIYLGNSIVETRAGTFDQYSYDRLALRVTEGYGFSFATDNWPYSRAGEPTAFWSYLYTLFLASSYRLFGHHPFIPRVFQAVVVGLLMPWFSYRIGGRLFNQRTGLISAALVTVYAYYVFYAGSLMTESFYIVCILWCVDAAQRIARRVDRRQVPQGNSLSSGDLRHGVELGLGMGLAILLRQVIVVLLIVLVLWLLWVSWRRNALKYAIWLVATASLVTSLLLLPFIYRNYEVFNRLTMPNTNAGFAFFWSNHPIYGTRFEAVLSPDVGYSYQDLIPSELRDLNEAELDRALLQRGLQFIMEQPETFFLLSLSRVPVYFMFWPSSESSLISNAARVLSFGILLPFMFAGLAFGIGLLGKKGRKAAVAEAHVAEGSYQREELVLVLVCIFSYALVHIISWANVRYRLPIDVFLLIFAAYAMDRLIEWRYATERMVNESH